MTPSGLRILLLGDYSNCHVSLAKGLGELGCDVTVASNGTWWMKTSRDVDISRKPGKLGGLMHYIKMLRLLKGPLSGFDVVAIHDPNFCSLKPQRLRKLFDILKKNNKAVFLTAMSTDLAFLDMLEAKDSPLRYSEWFVDGSPSRMYQADPMKWQRWHHKDLVEYQNYVFDNLDGAVSILYEYHLGMERRLGKHKVCYGGLPIDTSDYDPVNITEQPEVIKIFLGRDRTRKLMKGSDYLEDAAKAVVANHPGRVALEIVENVPFDEFKKRLRTSHIVLDQIYSYTPATTALMAMAYGIPAVTGAEPEYYEFIGEYDNRPIVNAPLSVPELTGVLEDIVAHPEQIAPRGKNSREFVVKHNDAKVVAARFLNFWMSRLKEKEKEARKC